MNKMRVYLLLAAIAASFSSMASEKVLVEDADGVVVTLDMLTEEFRNRPEQEKAMLRNKPEAKSDIINTLFRREKLLKKIDEMGVANDPAVQYRLRMAKKDVLILAAREQFAKALDIPAFDDLAKEKYLSAKDQYVVKEQVKASHIYFSADNDRLKQQRMPEAEAVLQKLKQGDSFEELAKEYSEDSSAAKGGDLGWFVRGQMVKPFEDVAFGLDVGGTSNIVQTKFGLHIIKLYERQDRKYLGYDEVAEKIKKELRDKYIKERVRSWFKETTDPISPKTDQKLIDSVDLSAIE